MLQVGNNGQMVGRIFDTKVGEIVTVADRNFRVMKVEKFPVIEFVLRAISGQLHDKLGFDEILMDEANFVTAVGDQDDAGITEVIGGEITMLWVNFVRE
jgi:hypothetical protein